MRRTSVGAVKQTCPRFQILDRGRGRRLAGRRGWRSGRVVGARAFHGSSPCAQDQDETDRYKPSQRDLLSPLATTTADVPGDGPFLVITSGRPIALAVDRATPRRRNGRFTQITCSPGELKVWSRDGISGTGRRCDGVYSQGTLRSRRIPRVIRFRRLLDRLNRPSNFAQASL